MPRLSEIHVEACACPAPTTRVALSRGWRTLLAGAFLSMALTPFAHASPVTWTLDNVIFDDGGTASGWFQWDASAWNSTLAAYDPWYSGGDYGDFSIRTSSGAGLGWNYDSSDGNNINYFANLWGATSLAWAGYAQDTPYIDLMFASSLTDLGGTVALVGGWECSDVSSATCREIVAGTVTAAASVPEPASLALVALAMAGLAVARKRNPGPRI